MTGTERIRWEPTQYGGYTGHVGTFEPWLFMLRRNRVEWVLSPALPGMAEHAIRDDDPRSVLPVPALKAEAERWLEEFVSSLGAVFPAGKPEVLGHPDDAAEEWLSEAYENADDASVGYERGEMINAFHAGSDWARGQIAKFGKDAAGRWITLAEPPAHGAGHRAGFNGARPVPERQRSHYGRHGTGPAPR